MEKALLQIGMDGLAGTEHIHQGWELVEEYPLSKELLAVSNVWRSPDGVEFIIAAKGAPEAVADLCHCTDEHMRELADQVQSMAGDGLRVLAAAKASFRSGSLPDGQHEFAFHFLGLIGFLDPVRQGVADALAECHSAGIRVIMITGDYPATAVKIARQIGLDTSGGYLTGKDLELISDGDLARRLETTSIVARAVPDQKLRIVRALRKSGNVAAMTGDGVNDAPSLKEADIGIAMGKRGTDVAREASALVLLDDAFSSIVGAIRMGRRIFDNLRKAMAYIIAVHVPIAGMSLLPIVFGWPLVLLPVHIVFLELIIDPACSVVFEAEDADPDIMKKPPRDPRDSLVNRGTLVIALSQGAVVLAVLLALFFSAYTMGLGADESRAFTFTTIVIANLGLIFVNRSWSASFVTTLRRPNRALWWVVAGSLFFLGLILTQEGLRTLFGFAPLGPFDVALALVAGLASVFWFELVKVWFLRHDHVPG
jgi:Ca2+-transporting ATPase